MPSASSVPAPARSTHHGVYGLRLDGDLSEELLVACDHDWPRVELILREGEAPPAAVGRIDDDRLVLGFGEVGAVSLDRPMRRVEFVFVETLSGDKVVHPYLAPVASVLCRWQGWLTFHAGGFVADGRSWAVLGGKGSGKSSLLGWLARHDYQVVADDLLAVDGSNVFAGPRCVDLRAKAAHHLDVGERLPYGPRERWRLRLDPISPSLPLAGWVFLASSDTVELVTLSARELLVRLAQSLSLVLPPKHPEHLLRLAALPGWELRRPDECASISQGANRLLEAIASLEEVVQNHVAPG
jgi:hypothetical protein